VSEPADFGPLGVVIGHATDVEGATGVTVVRGATQAFRCGSAIIGRATGTRELHATTPSHSTERIDAVMLTGGSAYGLDAAAGVMRWMEAHGRGYPIGGGVVPIVPAAVIFDLAPLGRFDRRPTPEMAYEACASATAWGVAQGSVGAGTGATVGKALGIAQAMKGGVGCATVMRGGMTAGAVAVVNAVGDVRDASGRILAGARRPSSTTAPFEFADAARVIAGGGGGRPSAPRQSSAPPNTTICAVVVDVALSRLQLSQLAQAASAALYRRITPAGTSADGDLVFALGPLEGREPNVFQAEALAVEALESAIENAVRFAAGRDGIPGCADVPGGGRR
jgi:L-aminopeptidase/D-esterase-like protein